MNVIDNAKESDVVKEEEKKQDDFDFSRVLEYAKLVQIQMRNLAETEQTRTFSKYTKANLITYLGAPDKYEKELRNMSIYLYNSSNYYRRLIEYLSGMLTYSYIISPYNLDFSKKIDDKKFKAQYLKVINYMDKMNIKHEFQKALRVALKQDVYYGFVYETNDSFMFQELDPLYCKIHGAEDGVYVYSFDNTYFDKYKTSLPDFDPLFNENYEKYKADGKPARWSKIPANRSICLKINEEVIYPIPPFVSLLPSLADIEDYKELSKASTETNNYKALSLEIPLNTVGDPLISWGKAKEYFDHISAVTPNNIGVFLTPMKVGSWDFQKAGVATDTTLVSNAEAAFWGEACVNNQLFGGVTSNSAALRLSAQTDEVLMFNVLRQIERWVNAKLKLMSGTFKFQAIFLNTTHYNQNDVYQKYLDMGRYGLPVRNAIAATMGIPPSATINMSYLENDVLKLYDKETPLKSSNTQSGSAGRPVEDTVGDAGEATRDGGTNEGASV